MKLKYYIGWHNMLNLIEDEIDSIEEIELCETMDIEVDGDRLFFANNILTHNSGYDQKEYANLTNMSESIKKVEHADFVGIIKNIQKEVGYDDDIQNLSSEADFRIAIAKNRSGPKDKIINLKSKFSHFRIDGGNRSDTILMSSPIHIDGSVL